MDSRGWIPIGLLASFNRVRQLTVDPQVVREVLVLSMVVEVCDEHVRMRNGEWRQFVLPDARRSTVDGGDEGDGEDPGEGEGDAEDEGEEDDDEDEVEFVIGREARQPFVSS